MSIQLPRLNVSAPIVDSNGRPNLAFVQYWHNFTSTLEDALNTLTEQAAALAAQEASLQTQIDRINSILDGTAGLALIANANEWPATQTFDVDPVAPAYKVGTHQVVGAQRPTIAPLAGSATLPDAIAAYNQLLASLKVHGLIAP